MKLLRLVQALTASASIATFPAFAQVSSSLLGTQSGTGVVGSALDALRTGASGNNAATGGKVGTFTLSAQEGTNQNFAVGTSTNLGINANASSTAEYEVRSSASLGLSGSNFKQVIGTSGTSENLATRAQSLTDYKAQSVQTEVGTTKTEFAQKAIDYSKQAGVTESDVKAKYGNWWSDSYKNQQASSVVATQEAITTGSTLSSSFTSLTNTVNERAAADFSKTSSFSDAANGIIRGSFNASEVSSTDTGAKTTNTTVTDTSWNAVQAAPGVTQRDAGTQKVTEVTVSAADSESSSTKNNTVVVAGIGNSANVNAGSGSTFTSTVSARSSVTAPTSNSATANGGAGASISSTSNANASNSSFASVFVQSF